MATQTIRVCDFNHGRNPAEGRTLKVAIGEEAFSIDLCAEHERELKSALTPFERVASRRGGGVASARRNGRPAGGRSGRPRAKAALRVADLTEAERAFAVKNGWGGKRLSNELIAKIQQRRGVKK